MRTIRSVVALCLVAAGCGSPFAHLPVEPPSAYVGAEAALRKGDFAAAERGFESYLASSPDRTYRARGYYRLAQTQYAVQNYRACLSTLETLVGEFPDQPGPQIPALAGDAHYALDEPVEAILSWEEAWTRASASDRELLRPRMQNALDGIDSSEAARLEVELATPEGQAMLETRSTAPFAVTAAPPAERALAAEREIAPERAPASVAAAPPVSAGIGEVWTAPAARPAAPGRPTNAEIESGIGHPYLPETAETESDETEPLPAVGCLLPLTGADRASGRRALDGLRLAFEGSPYVLAVQDTGSDPAIAELLVRKLAADGAVLAAIGPRGEADAVAVAPLADQLGLPTLLLSDQGGFVGRFVLQAATTRLQQVRALVRHATKTQGLSRFAALYPENDAGRAFVAVFADEVASQGGTLVGRRAYRPGQTTFGAETGVARRWAQESDVQAVFVPDDAETAILVAAALREGAPSAVLLGTENWHDAPVLARAGEAVEGAVFASSFHPGKAGSQSFASEFRQRAGDFPTGLEAQAYDAGVLVRRALEGGAATREEMLTALRAVGSYDGAGRIYAAPERFEREPVLLRVRQGEIEEVSG